ncbi:hypothetical protein HK102_013577 [Quaeritorhiza haematococci]|nr:hypothetical protein HK102_013577 [Quaeritorhiza haematococci]
MISNCRRLIVAVRPGCRRIASEKCVFSTSTTARTQEAFKGFKGLNAKKADPEKEPAKMTLGMKIKKFFDTEGVPWKELTGGQKVVQAGKLSGYFIIICGGKIKLHVLNGSVSWSKLYLTAEMAVLFRSAFYYLGIEAIDSAKLNAIHDEIISEVKNNDQVRRELGGSVKNQLEAEWTSRRTRRPISYQIGERGSTRFMDIQFPVYGTGALKGVVTAEMVAYGDAWKVHFIFVDIPAKKSTTKMSVDPKSLGHVPSHVNGAHPAPMPVGNNPNMSTPPHRGMEDAHRPMPTWGARRPSQGETRERTINMYIAHGPLNTDEQPAL